MVREEVKKAIVENYSSKKEVSDIYWVIKRLNEGEFVRQKTIKESLENYILFVEEFINKTTEFIIKAEINSVASKEVLRMYEQGIDEINEMMDK